MDLTATRPPQANAPRFDAGLVPALRSDHVALLALVRRAATAAAAGNADAARHALLKFSSLLSSHLLTQNTRLHLYIRATLHTPPLVQLSRAYQSEMNQIARGVVRFIDTYTASDRAVLGAAFMVDLDSVRETLAARFAREESALFPLYAPAG